MSRAAPPQPVATSTDGARIGELTAAGATALALSWLAPLGVASSEVADRAAVAFGVRRPFDSATALVDVLARLFTMLPVGEAGVRAQGLAAIAGMTTVALLVARQRGSFEAPARRASIAVAIGWLALSRPFLQVAALHPVAAVDLLLLVAAAFACEMIRQSPARASSGLTLALLCGLTAGAGWPVRAATWPFALLLTLRALRRGERWPLFAPIVFVAGAGVVLAGVVGAAPSSGPTLRRLMDQVLIPTFDSALAPAGPATARETWAWVIDDVGILGLLMSAMGIWLMVVRFTRQSVILILPPAIAAAASLWTGKVLSARLFLVVGLVPPLTLAVTFLAARFGRARSAVAAVLAVLIVVPAAMVGVGHMMRGPVREEPARVARGLDAAFDLRRLPRRQPSDPEAAAWWRYGLAIGLAPASFSIPADVRSDAP